jgi:RNA polymerase sigma-70 factor, ECF subfamily
MTSVDHAQWIETYTRLEKPLYNVVYRVLWNPAESQDVVQEAFLRCWRRKDDIRADGFTALLYSTALNLARNRRRRARVWRMVGVAAITDVSVGASDDSVNGEPISPVVRAAFDSLPEALRDVVLLTEIAGMTYPEAAAALGVAEGTIGSRRSRALKLLRERLEFQGVVSHEC